MNREQLRAALVHRFGICDGRAEDEGFSDTVIEQILLCLDPMLPKLLADIVPGQVFTVRYPFTRAVYQEPQFDEEGSSHTDVPTWKPGGYDWREHDYSDRLAAVADGAGELQLTVISVHQPGRYPTRVFFTRKWKSPDGKLFGRGKLEVVTIEKFRRTAAGYMHPWVVEDRGPDAVKAGD